MYGGSDGVIGFRVWSLRSRNMYIGNKCLESLEYQKVDTPNAGNTLFVCIIFPSRGVGTVVTWEPKVSFFGCSRYVNLLGFKSHGLDQPRK